MSYFVRRCIVMQAGEDGRPCMRPALPPSAPTHKEITDVLALRPAAGYWVQLVGPCAWVHTLQI